MKFWGLVYGYVPVESLCSVLWFFFQRHRVIAVACNRFVTIALMTVIAEVRAQKAPKHVRMYTRARVNKFHKSLIPPCAHRVTFFVQPGVSVWWILKRGTRTSGWGIMLLRCRLLNHPLFIFDASQKTKPISRFCRHFKYLLLFVKLRWSYRSVS